jgi:hypothetical protein
MLPPEYNPLAPTKDPQSCLSALPLDHLELLMQVWGDRTRALSELPQIQYVLPFENKGVEVGMTLHHPHGQNYAYPFIPPVPARMGECQLAYYQQHQRGLLQNLMQKEIAANQRILYQDEWAIAFVPVCARYPYEVWLAPIQPVASFLDLTAEQRVGLAMGGLGSDAAIETADVVLMTDAPAKVAEVIQVARKTRQIVVKTLSWQWRLRASLLRWVRLDWQPSGKLYLQM